MRRLDSSVYLISYTEGLQSTDYGTFLIMGGRQEGARLEPLCELRPLCYRDKRVPRLTIYHSNRETLQRKARSSILGRNALKKHISVSE